MDEIREVESQAIPETLAFFALGAPRAVDRIGWGLSNHNYSVRTEGGEYVIRFLVNQTRESIENEIAVEQQLRRAGIRAPRYLGNREGKFLYDGPRGIKAVVSEKIPGITPLHVGPGLAVDAGRHLALFHRAVRSLPRENSAGLLMPGAAAVTSEDARRLLDQPLPRGITHGDLHQGNILIDPVRQDRVAAILDFEEAGENLLLIDLAVTLMAFGGPTGTDSIDLGLMKVVLRGYESVRTLTAEEEPWLPPAMSYACEAWINWFRSNGFDRYARQHQRRYDSIRAILGAGAQLR